MDKEKKDTRDLISEYLKERGIKRQWLCDKLEFSPSHISLIFSKERELSEKNRTKINEILGTDF